MFDTEKEALDAIALYTETSPRAKDYTVEYCRSCEAWTIIGDDGYPFCYCA